MERTLSDNPVSIGYPFREGSISGFDKIVDDTVTTILTRGWSKEQIHQAILNFESTYGKDGLKQLTDMLMAHIFDYNNPHHVTIGQISSDIIPDLLGAILPGTPPSTPPVFGANGLLLIDQSFLPYTYTPGSGVPMRVTTSTGAIDTTDTKLPVIEYFDKRPCFVIAPLYDCLDMSSAISAGNGSQLGNTINASFPLDTVANGGVLMTNSTPTGTGLSTNGTVLMSDGTTSYSQTLNNGGVLCLVSSSKQDNVPFIPVMTSGDSSTSSTAIITVPPSKVSDKWIWTITFFVRPTSLLTYLSIVGSDPNNPIIFDATTGQITSPTPDILVGDVNCLANGDYRISVTVANGVTAGQPSTLSISGFIVPYGTEPAPISDSTPIWYIAAADMTSSPGMVPYTGGTTGRNTASVLTGSVPIDDDAQNLMLLLSLTSTPVSTRSQSDVLTFGPITISTTSIGYRVTLSQKDSSGNSLGSDVTIDIPNKRTWTKIGISLSPSGAMVKWTTSAKTTYAGQFVSNIKATKTLTMTGGPVYVSECVVYAESDRDKMLEFLTDA